MSNRKKNRAGHAANSVDSFNMSMLNILKTKQERLNLMERMAQASDNLNPSYLKKEPELELGMHADPESDWELKTVQVSDGS